MSLKARRRQCTLVNYDGVERHLKKGRNECRKFLNKKSKFPKMAEKQLATHRYRLRVQKEEDEENYKIGRGLQFQTATGGEEKLWSSMISHFS